MSTSLEESSLTGVKSVCCGQATGDYCLCPSCDYGEDVRDTQDRDGGACGGDAVSGEESDVWRRAIYVPAPLGKKERRKHLTHVTSLLNQPLQNLDWQGFEKLAAELLRKNPDDADYRACVSLSRPYALRVTSGALFALESLNKAEGLLVEAPSADFLRIRFLCMKAFLAHFLGRHLEAKLLHEEAIRQTEFLQYSNESASNLAYYCLNTLMHNQDLWGPNQAPLEPTWTLAEQLYCRSIQQHKLWIEDVEDHPKLKEEDLLYSPLSTMIRYLMCRIRSCYAPCGFHRLMNAYRIPPRVLDDVDQQLREIRHKLPGTCARVRYNYAILLVDYNLRHFQLGRDRNKYLSEAERWANDSLGTLNQYREKKLSYFIQTFTLCRLDHIKSLKAYLRSKNHSKITKGTPYHSLLPVHISNSLSHRDSGKPKTYPEHCSCPMLRHANDESQTVPMRVKSGQSSPSGNDVISIAQQLNAALTIPKLSDSNRYNDISAPSSNLTIDVNTEPLILNLVVPDNRRGVFVGDTTLTLSDGDRANRAPLLSLSEHEADSCHHSRFCTDSGYFSEQTLSKSRGQST